LSKRLKKHFYPTFGDFDVFETIGLSILKGQKQKNSGLLVEKEGSILTAQEALAVNGKKEYTERIPAFTARRQAAHRKILLKLESRRY
jgi:hypothetical protein